MENKVRYDDAMAADDIGVSVWALRCNVRARETSAPYLMPPCSP